jgi:trigger factor
MRAEARRYGDMAQRMFDYLRENAQARAQLQAPLYEEKVVDLILSKAKVADQTVSKEALLAEDDLPEGIAEPAEAPKKAAKKPAKAKAAKEEPASEVASVEAAAETPAEAAKPKRASKAKAKAEPTAEE